MPVLRIPWSSCTGINVVVVVVTAIQVSKHEVSTMKKPDAECEKLLRTLESHEGLTAETRKTYVARLIVMKRELGASSVIELMRTPETFEARLRADAAIGVRKPSTTRNWVSTLLAMFKYIDDSGSVNATSREAWKAYHDELKRAQEEVYAENRPLSEGNDRAITDIADIKRRVQVLRDLADRHQQRDDSLRLVMMTMYATMPPKRSDYGSLRIVTSDDDDTIGSGDDNYVYMGTAAEEVPARFAAVVTQAMRSLAPRWGVLVMKKYKTAKTFGETVEALPAIVLEELDASLERWPRKFVFVSKRGHPMSNNMYTKYVMEAFEKEFGRKTGTTLLRHAFVTALKFDDTTMKERHDIGVKMGHNTTTQEKYKWIPARPPATA